MSEVGSSDREDTWFKILQGRLDVRNNPISACLRDTANPFFSTARRTLVEKSNLGIFEKDFKEPLLFADRVLTSETRINVVQMQRTCGRKHTDFSVSRKRTLFLEVPAETPPDNYKVYRGNVSKKKIVDLKFVASGTYVFDKKTYTKNDLLQAIGAASYIQSQTFLAPLQSSRSRYKNRSIYRIASSFDKNPPDKVTTGTVNISTLQRSVICDVGRHCFSDDNDMLGSGSVAERSDTLASDICLGLSLQEQCDFAGGLRGESCSTFDESYPRTKVFLNPPPNNGVSDNFSECTVGLDEFQYYDLDMRKSSQTDEHEMYEYALRGMDIHGNVQFSKDRNGFVTELWNSYKPVKKDGTNEKKKNLVKSLKWANGTDICALVHSGEIKFERSRDYIPEKDVTGLEIFSRSSYILSSEHSIDGTLYRQNLAMQNDGRSLDKETSEFSRLSDLQSDLQGKRQRRTVLSGNVELYLG
jgi:hypothetical protein